LLSTQRATGETKMTIGLATRKDAKYKVICTAPDVCKIASGTPVPFPITETLNNSAKTAKKTNFNGKKAFMLKSHTTKVTGDEAGVGGGIKSGTNMKKAEPIDHSSTVKVEGSWSVRVKDKVYMNNKNTIGIVVPIPAPIMGAISDTGEIL